MGLRLVMLATTAARAGDVEVPQADGTESMREAEVADHPVDRKLRSAIGVGWIRRRSLRNRNLLGLPVDRTGGREHEPLDTRDAHRIEDIWQYLYRGAYWRGGPVTMSAIAAA